MASTHLVSTIIPTYNRKTQVRTAIVSALSQSYDQQEIIVVDDGSTDGTQQALEKEFGKAIRYFYKPNGGVSSARNLGIEKARGEYIAFLDSDDKWASDKLRLQVEYLRRHPDFGMVVTDIVFVQENRNVMYTYRRRNQLPRDGWVLCDVVRKPMLVPASILTTRKALELVGGFDTSLRTAEDIDFHLRMALRFQVGVIELPLVRCRYFHGGLSDLAQTNYDYIHVVERFIFANEHCLDPKTRDQGLFNVYHDNARGLIWAGAYLHALQVSGKMLRRLRTPTQALASTRLSYLFMRNLGGRVLRELTVRD